MKRFVILMLSLVLAGCGSSQPKTLIVNPDGSGDYATITEAVKNSNAGDTLKIKPGNYEEKFQIEKDITIAGDGPRQNIKISYGRDVISITAGTTRLSGLTVMCSDDRSYGIQVTSGAKAVIEECDILAGKDHAAVCIRDKSDGVIRKCKVFGGGVGIYVHHASTATIEDCEVLESANTGILIFDESSGKVLRSKIHHNKQWGVRILKKSSVTFSENRVYDNGKSGLWVEMFSKAVSTKNNFERNKSQGLCAVTDSEVEVNEDTYTENGHGCHIDQRAKATLRNCRIFKNLKSGVISNLDAKLHAVGNDVTENAVGFQVFKGAAVLEKNKIYAQKENGIVVGETHHDVRCVDNEVFGNDTGISASESSAVTILNNKIYENKDSGIYFLKKSNGNIERNTIYKNNSDGIGIYEASTAVIGENVLYRNNGHAILNKSGSVSLLSNEDYDNGAVSSKIKERAPASSTTSRLTPAQKGWAMAACGVLIQRNDEFHELLGGWYPTEEQAVHKRKSLEEWWSIHNRNDLLQQLESFKTSSHDRDFRNMMLSIRNLDNAQFQLLLQKYKEDPELVNRITVVRENQETLREKGLIGWEYSRYICLCRWGYISNYLSEEEAWNLIMPAAKKLQTTFSSWEELGQNYMTGFRFWSLERQKETGKANREAFDFLMNDPSSIWKKYSWDTDLTVTPPPAQ